METYLVYIKYYLAILISVIFVKVFFVILNRRFKNNLALPRNFLLATFVFSYIGLSIGIFIGIAGQTAITLTALALLLFLCGTISLLFFNDTYNTSYNRKIAAYSLAMIALALIFGSDAGAYQRRITEDIDARTFFQPEMRTEKNKTSLKGKKEMQATAFNKSK